VEHAVVTVTCDGRLVSQTSGRNRKRSVADGGQRRRYGHSGSCSGVFNHRFACTYYNVYNQTFSVNTKSI